MSFGNSETRIWSSLGSNYQRNPYCSEKVQKKNVLVKRSFELFKDAGTLIVAGFK